MKKIVVMFIALVIMLQVVSALDSYLKDIYEPKETMISELQGQILAPINLGQVKLKRANVEVPFQGNVKKLGNNYYIWLIAPQTEGNYKLIIEDVIESVVGVPKVGNFEKNFLVQGDLTDYSIVPGAVFATNDFSITASLYENSGKQISVNFPEVKQVNLVPGNNKIDFSIKKIVGNLFAVISVGKYSVPAFISGAEHYCGDGKIDGGEVCDGANLEGNDCTTVGGGYVEGTLSCSSSCLSFNINGCVSESSAKCDSENLGLCSTLTKCKNAGGHWWSDMTCRTEAEPICESKNLELCQSAGTCIDASGYWYDNKCNPLPKITCNSNNLELCSSKGTCIDASGYWYDNKCNVDPKDACDSEHFELCFTQGTCIDASGYWYDNKCNEFVEGSKCDEEHLGLCESKSECTNFFGFWFGENCNIEECSTEFLNLCKNLETCENKKGFWFDNRCNKYEEGVECDSDHLDLCIAPGICSSFGGYWYDNQCNRDSEGSGFIDKEGEYVRPYFIFKPRIIKSKVLKGSDPLVYSFEIFNFGEAPINSLSFFYDEEKYDIDPSEELSLDLNESKNFNLTIRGAGEEQTQGAILGVVDEVFEYLLFEVEYTENKEDVETNFLKSSSKKGSGYYCSELDGVNCAQGESCVGSEVSSLDGVCCVGFCEEASEESSGGSYIGYLIIGITLLVLLILFIKYRKAGKVKSPTARRFSDAERRLP